jgi:hypothetical protein
LFSDGDEAVFVDAFSEEHIYAESNDLEPFLVATKGRITPVRVEDGVVHMTAFPSDAAARQAYYRGPLQGPFKLIDRLDVPAVFPRSGPFVPVRFEDGTLTAGSANLSAQGGRAGCSIPSTR